jgi:transposase
LKCRDKECIVKYLQANKHGLFAHLEEVTTDMWEGYVNAVLEVFEGKVRVTIDRFHVMKNFQECLTEARRQIQRGMSKDERDELKGSRWLWMKNWENLNKEERQQLEQLKQRFPLLRQLAEQREQLRAIFEDRTITNASEGVKRLTAWLDKAKELGLKALEKFARTLNTWMDKIANYFVTRSSNGRTEGFNHAMRSILWRAFGMSNFEHFRLRVLARYGRPAHA